MFVKADAELQGWNELCKIGTSTRERDTNGAK